MKYFEITLDLLIIDLKKTLAHFRFCVFKSQFI